MSFPFQYEVDQCLQVLAAGGIILYPTDTVWGIGCDATCSEAVERIYQLKHRADHKAMIVLVADERDILQYVAQPDLQVFDYIKGVQRPTTVIYDNAVGLADNLMAPDGSVGIRICNDLFCRHLLKRLRKPLVSTSANISGYPAPGCFRDIDEWIVSGVDYAVQYRREETDTFRPSSVVKWEKDGSITILRA
jgi:L-threonylcarbamoyladenylate synthase